jgi:tetratricopeptide (TPR) repeat protein
MEERPIAGIAHNHDTKHRIVRYPGQPLPEIAFESPQPDLPGLLWLNRPSSNAKYPAESQLEAYWTVAGKDPSLWPYWERMLAELETTAPDDPVVLNSLGAVALVEKKDNAKAADYFARALKLGSEEPTTYLNLATALYNAGQASEAESVLERGLVSYPNSGPMVAKLALDYASGGKAWQARALIKRYRKNFPEDSAVRDALSLIDRAEQTQEAPGYSRGNTVAPPR